MPVPESQKNSSPDSLDRSQGPTVRRPPPPPSRLRPPSQNRGPSKRVILATGFGVGLTALLILLLLLILLSRGCSTGEGGGGGSSAGGEGAGSGTGFGDGSGPGTGHGPSEKAGAGADATQAGTPTTAEASRKKAGSAADGSAAAAGDGPKSTPPPRDVVTINPLIPAPPAAPGSPADEFGGGAGGGGSPGTSEFFGVEAKGARFVYVVDSSSSMGGRPFEKACDELIASIEDLGPRQKFFAMFFNTKAFAQFNPQEENQLIPATKKNKDRLRRWVQSRSPGGGTDPGDALIRGLDLKPDAIFLLTDGSFTSRVVSDVRAHNKNRIVIHTISFMNRSGEPLLKQIAKENKGTYRFVP